MVLAPSMLRQSWKSSFKSRFGWSGTTQLAHAHTTRRHAGAAPRVSSDLSPAIPPDSRSRGDSKLRMQLSLR